MLLKVSKTTDPEELTRAAGSLTPRRSGGALCAFLLLARSTSATTFPVSMTDFAFTPASQTINVGDTVTWNGVSDSHTATSGTAGTPSGVWDSGNVDPGGAYSFTFTTPGNYPYYCTYHYTVGMIGAITVQAGNAPPSVSINNPTNGASFAAGSNIPIQASASDSDGSIARVDFFANGVALGSVTNLPYTVTMNSVASGQYALSAVATDNLGASATSSIVNITVQAGNVPPSISITNPIDGQAFFVGDTVLVQMEASDADGSVTQVDLLLNTNLIAVLATPPYDFAITNLAAGNYVLTAEATDNQGATSTSTNVHISVNLPTESPTILVPPRSQTVTVGDTVTLSVTAGGTAPLFYDWQFGGTDIPGANSNLLVLSAIQTNQAGNYQVVVTNSVGSVTSQVAVITVNLPANIPPVVSLTSPTNGARFPLNAPVTLSADASDPDGSVSQVEFFANSTSLGVVTNGPFSLVIRNFSAGNLTLTARATDNRGGVTASSPVAIVIVSPPSVTLIQPTNGAAFPVGSTVALQATAQSAGGSISSVQFFAGTTSLGTATAPPFGVDWTPGAPGSVTLMAIAADDLGQMTASTAIVVRAFLPDDIRPTLRVTKSPANFARLNTAGITLAGIAADNVGLDRVEFQINHGRFSPAAGTADWQAQVQLSPGLNTVGIRAVDLAGNSSVETFRYFTFVVNSRLALEIVGAGRVTPALGGQLLEVGKAYRLTAQPGIGQAFAGWGGGIPNLTSPQLQFLMQSNLQLTATFVPSPFFDLAGSYAGLVLNTNGAYPANSAGFNLQLTTLGSFSGKLLMNGSAFPFTGRFDLQGSAKASALRRGMTPVLLTLQLGLDPASSQITGNATDGTWTSPLVAVRTFRGQGLQTGPQGARRPFALKQTDTASGGMVASGVSRISTTGSVNTQGTLADGRAFGAASPISAAGQVPFYDSMSRGSEILAGWIQFDLQGTSPPSGYVIWSKALTNGFSELLQVTPE